MTKNEKLLKALKRKLALLDLTDAEYALLGIEPPKRKPPKRLIEKAAKLVKALKQKAKKKVSSKKIPEGIWYTS
jgi:hypothetical protein